jgi:hypothetical protein
MVNPGVEVRPPRSWRMLRPRGQADDGFSDSILIDRASSPGRRHALKSAPRTSPAPSLGKSLVFRGAEPCCLPRHRSASNDHSSRAPRLSTEAWQACPHTEPLPRTVGPFCRSPRTSSRQLRLCASNHQRRGVAGGDAWERFALRCLIAGRINLAGRAGHSGRWPQVAYS